MDYGRFCKIWWGCVLVGIILMSITLVAVDPIGLFGTPRINGFNHFKAKEGSYLEVYKPYQFARTDAKAVMIGNSRVYVGMQATLNGYKDEEVYNLGCSNLSLKNAEHFLDYVYATKNPDVVLLGLDFFQFSKENYESRSPGFSLQRLKNLTVASDTRIKAEAFKDSFYIFGTVIPTVKESMKNKDAKSIFVRGWHSKWGSAREINKGGFYSELNINIVRYGSFDMDDRAFMTLERIADKSKQKGVKLYVFFNPLGCDLRSMIYSLNLNDEMSIVKTRVTNVFGKVYDFSFVNYMTTSRNDYLDASHFNNSIGEKMKSSMISEMDSYICFILTPENVDAMLAKEDEAYYKWAEANKEYVEELARKTRARESINEGEFDKYFEL